MKDLRVWVIICTIVTFLSNHSTEIVRPDLPSGNYDPYMASLELDLSDLIEVTHEFGSFRISPGDIQTVIDLTKLGLGLVQSIRNLFDENFNGSAFDNIQLVGGEERLLSMFQSVSNRLNEIQAGVAGVQISLRHLITSLPHLVRWEVALSSISEYALPINSLYHKFNFYQIHRDKIEDHTLTDFATSVVTHDTSSVQALMANIHAMIAPSDPPIIEGKETIYGREEYKFTSDHRVDTEYFKKLRKLSLRMRGKNISSTILSKIDNIYFRRSIFSLLADTLEDGDICNMVQSPQGIIYGFYALLSLTQARGYAMMKFAWYLLRYYKKGDFIAEQQLSDELYDHYSKGLHNEVIKALSSASNLYRKCDPKVHEEGKTYEMIKELLQGYIENEVDLNVRKSCAKECSSYEHAEVYGCFMPETQYCGKHRRCKGKVHDCSFLYSDAFVCMSEEKHRRYDWIRYPNLEVLGKENSCNNLIAVNSWWRVWFHCSYCICYCDDPSSSSTERYVSLLPSVSDIAVNKVITGVRFTKKNRVMHIQVQEGKTMPHGQIMPNSQRWVTVEPISIEKSNYVAGNDYVVLRYETRRIDLDVLKAPRGHAITGLRFQMLGSHVNLEMWVTPINFTNGVLKPDLSYWISNVNTPVMHYLPRKEIVLSNPNDPRYSINENQVRSENNTFIKLRATSLYTDVGQLTVPFFDAQAVSPNPPVWLQGIEIYFRGTGNSGGFLGFSIQSYNLTSHLQQEIF